MKGIFELRTGEDLFQKLQRDHQRLCGDKTNSDLAFNFFVTAWHLPEWLYPDDPDRQQQIKDSDPLLRICEHIAVGAKHFSPTGERHNSVKDTRRASYFRRGLGPHGLPTNYFADDLFVDLESSVAEAFGMEQITVLDLANRILAYWRDQLGES